MANSTFPTTSARVLEIFSYLALIPALFGVFVSLIWVFMSPVLFIFTVIICAFAGFGVYLLTCYFKFSRGRLDKDKALVMWMGTAFYNAILASPFLYFLEQNLRKLFNGTEDFEATLKTVVVTFIIAAVYCTITFVALRSHTIVKYQK